jgi:hypothetical protein
LTFHELLGSGQFGEVFGGTYTPNGSDGPVIDVAIKKLKTADELVDKAEFEIISKRFIREASNYFFIFM